MTDGDFAPTYNVTRVLLFFFAVLSIAFREFVTQRKRVTLTLRIKVGVILSSVVDFIGKRAEARKTRWRRKFEKAERQKQARDKSRPKRAVVLEIAHLQEMEEKELRHSQRVDLLSSVASLIVFWFVGAAIFARLEESVCF